MWALLAAAYLVVAVLLHAALTRLPVGPNVVVRFVVAGTLVGAALAVHLWARYGVAVETVTGLLVYALASELYIFLFTLASSSVSAALLLTLLRGPLSDGSIEDRYSPDLMVDARIAKLVANGFMVERAGGYELTDKRRRIVATFARLQLTFRHPERTEHEQPA